MLTDDIKIVYRKMKRLKKEIDEQIQNKSLASKRQNELVQIQAVLERRAEELNNRLIQARVSLNQLDSTKLIQEEEKRLVSLNEEMRVLSQEKGRLELFQTKVSEILYEIMEEGCEPEKKEVLASLCNQSYSKLEKESAVSRLKKMINERYDHFTAQWALVRQEIEKLEQKLNEQERILEETKKRRNTYAQVRNM